MEKSIINSVVLLCYANVYLSKIEPGSGGASHNAKGLVPFIWMPTSQAKEVACNGELNYLHFVSVSFLAKLYYAKSLNFWSNYGNSIIGKISQWRAIF
jgi:hypothetical protein